MSDIYHLSTPLQNTDLINLKIGDKVLISGKIYTARDVAHQRLVKLMEISQPLPFDIKGTVIYYAGPAPARPGNPIGSVGPTSSYRMDKFTPPLLSAGVKATIGKGERSQDVIDAIIRYQAVYFVAVGGAAVVAAQAVKTARIVAFEELGPEAIYELTVVNFPVFVAIDVNGNDLFRVGVARYRQE
ncbi:MAG TPA: Fe-S-containing hydro-lyase [Candidatus Marinimicrobia bacterium]|nr:Fe-S-containing hydro-lyase [Candidatus Neomarinimicrobiota bacterium]HOV23083.1 Fe-S-containing hydro-lyase [Candidatus Neomarinimicrobiota bacterium]